MGSLNQYDLGAILRRDYCPVFIETGTGHGNSLRYAQQFPFTQLYSIEADPVLAGQAIDLTRSDSRVMIRQGDTIECLPGILRALEAHPTPPAVCCWLDAHYPAPGLTVDALPLGDELELLATYTAFARSVILIDDRRIYERDSYQAGNLPPECLHGDHLLLGRFEERVRATHWAERSTLAEGTCAFYPRHA